MGGRIINLVVCALFISFGSLFAENHVLNSADWVWYDKHKLQRNRDELEIIINNHMLWLSDFGNAVAKHKKNLQWAIERTLVDSLQQKIENDTLKTILKKFSLDERRCNLDSANLSGIILVNDTDLRASSLRRAFLNNAVLCSTKFGWSNLSGAKICNAKMLGIGLWGTELTDAMLSSSDLTKAFMRQVDFAGVILDTVILCFSDMQKSNLRNAKLHCADISGVNLDGSNMSGADLSTITIKGTHISNVRLVGAMLRDFDGKPNTLSGAELSGLDLTAMDLSNVTLSKAKLYKAKLTGMCLSGADFADAKLDTANLDSCDLAKASMLRASLRNVSLQGGKLDSADFTGACLKDAVLTNATLVGTVLDSAEMTGVLLKGAVMKDTNLSGTNLSGADLSGVLFEPKSFPSSALIGYAKHLALVKYTVDSAPIANLKKQLYEDGFRTASKQVNAALRRKDENILEKIFFDWTCEYGSNYWKPLILLLKGFGGFCVIYFALIALRVLQAYDSKPYLYLITDAKGLRKENEESPILWRKSQNRLAMFWISFLFSIERTFRLGFKDFSPNHWLKMIMPPDFDIKSRGWVRFISTVQSIFSVYMIVLFLVSYFGRLFD
jgi:uncharacterized protein YjbI with pentapeptide repeats